MKPTLGFRAAFAASAALLLGGCVAAVIPVLASSVVAKRAVDMDKAPAAEAPPPGAAPSPQVIVGNSQPPPQPQPDSKPSAAPANAARVKPVPTPPAESEADPLPAPLPRIDVARMQDMVRTLSSDDFGGRAPATNAEAFVLDAIVRQFEAAGLRPGNNGQWLQSVPVTEIAPSGFTQLTVRGGVQQVSYVHGSEYVAISPSGPARSELKDAPMVFAGYGVVAPELGWNDYAGTDMHGKVAVVLINDPDWAAQTGPFGGRAMTYYGRWTYKIEEAARQGAAGVLMVHDTQPAGYGWSVVQSGWTGPQHSLDLPGQPVNPTVAQGWIQLPVAKEIFRAAGKNFDAMAKAAAQPGFTAQPLGVTASLGFVNAIRKTRSYNVIGVLPGKTRADEYVLYTAHWDHLGTCAPDAKDSICNGAVDNATGIAALAELAAMNVRAGAPARSQVFIATTLEESGLLGSEYYAANPVYPLARTAGGVNMDSLPPGGWSRDVVSIGGDKSELTALLEPVLAEMKLKLSPDPAPEKGLYYRSDHFTLAKRGVPMLDLKRGLDLVRGGTAAGKAAADDYNTNRYHAPGDEYAADWDWAGIMQDVELFYRTGRALAESRAWPDWHPGEEFRNERDRTAAERGQ